MGSTRTPKSPLATCWLPSMLGPLGLIEAQGTLPLGHCALSPPLSASPLATLWLPTLLGPLGLIKAQGALSLGRRALSLLLSASSRATPRGLPPCVLIGSEKNPDPSRSFVAPGRHAALARSGGALTGQRCPSWLHQRCLDRDPSSRRLRTRPCQGGAGHRRLRVLQGEPRESVCP